MAKIKEISFKNYRAFWSDKNKLKINGKNVLIYGENGSGKSSLYQGLKDFFTAADVNWTVNPIPVHLKAKGKDYEVKVVLENPSKSLIFNGQPIEDETIGQTFLLNSFLSYKEMLRTHFLEREEFNEKLFELLTQSLLKQHEIGDLTVERVFKEIRRLHKSRKREDKDLSQLLLDNFNVLFPNELAKISTQCGKILEYFYQDIKVEFQPQPILIYKNRVGGNIGLKVDYIGEEYINHLEILNEARLSALAISIYLAAIVTNPVVQKANYKILFLDDVFIGLDTSNRLPLLKILQKFSIDGVKPFFEDFQIFITTYDRYWFKLAKNNLGESWITAEIYVGEEIAAGVKLFDKPVIIQDQLEPLEKAEKFFAAFDYYSAGNYLRKALEKILEDLVDITYRIEAKDLEGNISKLLKYYNDCNCQDLISDDLRNELKMYKDSVLNPSSHYDLKSPLYKAEIEATIQLVKSLQNLPKIERKLLIGMKSSLCYKNDGKKYEAEYLLKENVYAIKIQGQPTRITDAKHSITSWSLDAEKFSKPDGTFYESNEVEVIQKRTNLLSERGEKISKFLGLAESPNWKEFTDVEGKTINQLADDI